MISNTIHYYNRNAEQFAQGTVGLDLSEIQIKFLEEIPEKGYILDFGCGSGRDSKIFLEKGYEVDAVDGSETLCRLASEYTGIKVKKMMFQELKEVDKYDGIWACASILHTEKIQLPLVLRKIFSALKTNGVLYTSFKYGEFEGARNGRYFLDLTEDTFAMILRNMPELVIEKQWITNDVRPKRGDEKWLNLILRKR